MFILIVRVKEIYMVLGFLNFIREIGNVLKMYILVLVLQIVLYEYENDFCVCRFEMVWWNLIVYLRKFILLFVYFLVDFFKLGGWGKQSVTLLVEDRQNKFIQENDVSCL